MDAISGGGCGGDCGLDAVSGDVRWCVLVACAGGRGQSAFAGKGGQALWGRVPDPAKAASPGPAGPDAGRCGEGWRRAVVGVFDARTTLWDGAERGKWERVRERFSIW